MDSSHILYGVIVLYKRAVSNFPAFSGYDFLGLILCGAFFLCGCIAGTFSSASPVEAGGQIPDYIKELLALAQEQSASGTGFFHCLFNSFKYPALSFFFAFSVLGVFFVPALCAVRGFFLCFSISMIVRVFQWDGALLGISAFLFSVLINVPCFLVMSVSAFSNSLSFFRSVFSRGAKLQESPFAGRFFKKSLVGFFILVISAVLEMLFTFGLISLAASRIIQ